MVPVGKLGECGFLTVHHGRHQKTACAVKAVQAVFCLGSGFAGGLDVFGRVHAAFDRAMLLLETAYALADKDEYLTVDGPAFIIGDIADLRQHFIFEADGYALHGFQHPI